MRRALRPLLPGWAELFGLKPWEICGGPDSLTFGEIEEFAAYVRRRNAAIDRASKER